VKLRRAWQIFGRVWISVGLGVTAVFIVWSVVAYRATTEARSATRSDAVVSVGHSDGLWRFAPNGGRTRDARFVFFPGALVDPRAYAPLARTIAEAGYRAIIIELPRRGAFGGADSPTLDARVDSVLSSVDTSVAVVIGGHSRGAVVASRVAAGNAARLAGLVIIGSSHPRDHDLSGLTIPVTKIAGTRDGLASPGEVRQNADLLPLHTRWIWIEGGNHSQFGWYGFQPLDRRPRVSASMQRAVMIEGVLDMMHNASQRLARESNGR
jgi:hypothetical protein